jgi:type IV pilus assembly protein PilN
MKIPINLASQPFRRDRPIVVGAVALSLLLMALLGVLVWLARLDRAQLADSRQTLAQLERQLRAANAEQTRLDSVLRQPENAVVLERSIFLNALLTRKGISWTHIFADLEKTLPHNVRIISIRPSLNGQNQVSLDMVVGTESPEPMVAFLQQLEKSPLFGSTTWHSTVPPSQTNPLYQYRISVNYAQKL